MKFPRLLTKRTTNLLLFVFLFSCPVAYAQSSYESRFPDRMLREMLKVQFDSVKSYLYVEEYKIARDVELVLKDNDDSSLVKAEIDGYRRNIILSNAFLRHLAKLMDASIIESNVKASDDVFKYARYCVDNYPNSVKAPADFYSLSSSERTTFNNRFNNNARMNSFLLAVRFVLAHELAHHLKGHLTNEDELVLHQEIEADEFAIEIMNESGWPPLFIGPLLMYFYLQDMAFQQRDEEFTHPSGLERISKVINGTLGDLKYTYERMQELGDVNMSFNKMHLDLTQAGLYLYWDLFEDLSEDYDTYEVLAEKGNTAAMVKMGLMHFRGIEGWEKDEEKGMEWLKKAAKKSDLASLLLGMFYEYQADIAWAHTYYSRAQDLGNYYASILKVHLYYWNDGNMGDYGSKISSFLKNKNRLCMQSCQSDYNHSYDKCKLFFCNYSLTNMYQHLMEFRNENPIR